MLEMPIAQVITFLNFEMCHICVNIYIYPMFTHLYPHDMYRINNEIYIFFPCE